MLYIGLDLGTSGLKGLLVDKDGNIIKEENAQYSVSYPHDGWSEQNPADWLIACRRVLANLARGNEPRIGGISFGGQMHGLVILDAQDTVIRPCILWNDGRTARETAYLNDIVGKEKLSAYTGNIAFAGFTAPKLLWLRENEPQNFARIAKIMLPKDYLAYMLTGTFSTDYSDASGTLLLDVRNKRWSDEMCEICHIRKEQLPQLYESYAVIGKPKPEYGLPNAIVTAGAGDNAAAAVGTGTVENGACNISLGTSGTLFIASDTVSVDEKNALHSFCHATGRWHLMGCILSAASANKWWLEEILKTDDYAAAVRGAESLCGCNNVYFLPYLMGERSPHNDVNARGAFIGLSASTTREECSLAVLEGVALALRDCIEVACAGGATVARTAICGGGAKSALWKQIIADVLNMPVDVPKTEQGPAFGAAMLAMVGAGAYTSVQDAAAHIVQVRETVAPNSQTAQRYNEKYSRFRRLYPALRQAMQ